MSEDVSLFRLYTKEKYDVPEQELIWKEGVPGFEPDGDNQEVVTGRSDVYYDRFIRNIRIPAIYSFPAAPENNTGKAVVICPGGGYEGTAIDKEGFDIARRFNSVGVSAFVLKYRCPAPDGRLGLWREGPLNDACRAIRLVRSRAAELGITKVGIMGFSSGGHLAATTSTLYSEVHDICPELDKFSCKPDFSILIYPVITLVEDFRHQGSRDRLLGPEADDAMVKKFSPEFNVNPDTPPVFLAQTEDDMVHVYNSINYYKAAAAAKVPAEMHIFSEGGHGYGMSQRGLPVDTWSDRMIEWVSRI